MFNLLKSSSKIVAKIHNEFDVAQEKLLLEAKKIIESNKDSDKKAERLIKIGFVNSEVAAKQLQKNKKLVHGTQQAELIEYYKETYPFQKFITEPELNRIAKKYNLIYAPIGNYTKDVPEKNIKEIEETSNLKSCDTPNDLLKCRIRLENFMFPDDIFLNWWYPLWWTLPRLIDGKFSSTHDVNRYLKSKFNTGSFEYLCSSIQNIIISRQGLFIAAPASNFNLKGLHKEGLLNSTISIIEIKDPIVFRYVRGGIQIISKWGLEAQDESLVNEKNN